MYSYLTEYGKCIIMECKLLKWQKLYEEIETNYRYNAYLILENKQVSTETFEYEALFETLLGLADRGYDFLLANKDNENRIYKIIKNFSNILIENQKNNYAHNMNEIENIMTNLEAFVNDLDELYEDIKTNLEACVNDLDELYEDIKTNYNNIFIDLSKDKQQKYKDALVGLMMLKSTEIMIELDCTNDEDY
jgi:hypothetical protein